MSEALPEQERAALEWLAEEAHAARAVDAKVAELQAPPPAPPQTPEQAAQAAQAAQLAAVVEAQLPKICGVAWAIVDRLVQSMAGSELALTAEERAQLAEATVPVVNKYLPQGMGWLTTTPEGALVMTAGMIYGFKMLAPAQAGQAQQPTEGATA